MSTQFRRATQHLEQLLLHATHAELAEQLAPRHGDLPPRVPGGTRVTPEAIAQRWNLLPVSTQCKTALTDATTRLDPNTYRRNIENYIGTIQLPVGLAGPLRVNGLFARGDYYVPLATTEAALVASYDRGAHLMSMAGGCSAVLLAEGVSRAPGFAFHSISEASVFVSWAVANFEHFRTVAAETTRHGALIDLRVTIEGNYAFLVFDYTTGDAAGQNMVTIATEAICKYIIGNSPVTPEYHFIEANLSGDKKASAQSFQSVRGKKVSADVTITAELVEQLLHTTVERMVDYWRMSTMGGAMSGIMGVQGHYANGLAALYLACGQDVACVAESAVGITRFEMTGDGSLYATVMLPNLIVGTVGGGTQLPTQAACLEILGLAGEGKARAFAEVCAAVALAGELSIAGALSAGDFTRAHQRLARATQKKVGE